MFTVREAGASDAGGIIELLKDNGLRHEAVLIPNTRYWVAGTTDRLVGAIGLELGDSCVLLRSAVVIPSERGKGIGRALTDDALRWSRQAGYQTAYCFSTEAGDYWVARGFLVCPVDEVVCALPSAPQITLFRELGWLPTEVAYRRRLTLG